MSYIQYSRRFPKIFRLGIVLSCILVLAAVPSSIQEYGIETPSPIGKYLDGVFSETTPGGAGEWEAVMAFPNLTFVDPIQMLELPGTNKFLMAGKKGKLWTFENDYFTNSKQVFLDIENQVRTAGDAGLLGVALHPEYGQAGSPNKGYIYVYYRYTLDQSREEAYLRLSRFHVPDGADQADRNSELPMIQLYDRNDWHNGGGLFFGTDGFLYLTIGDEGGANDSYNVAQQINKYFYGGLLRIDVDKDPARSHPIRRQPQNTANPPFGWPNSYTDEDSYYIPNDNPWLDPNGSILEEFYALGLRSPHRATQDPLTGDVWVGDVGQASREEISIVRRGYNMQWPYKEGNINGPKSRPNPLIGMDKDPVYDYGRSMGTCIIGGFVYRGEKWQSLLGGKYIFGDHTVRNVWALAYNENSGSTDLQFMVNIPAGGVGDKSGISSFATDREGNIYVLKLYGTNRDGGIVYKIQPRNYVPEAPTWLSQTGAFSDLQNLTPRTGLIPYTVNSPLWSDGSIKKRWIALPNNGTHNTSAEQIGFSTNSEWSFPEGTVFIKHFELPIDENNPEITKRLETRFLVRTTNGGVYGVTYKWNEAQTDARLLTGGDSQTYTINEIGGGQRSQTWDFPSRSDCLTCHNANAGHILGVKTHQLNGNLFYNTTNGGMSDNQLRVWNHLGMLRPRIDESQIESLPKTVPLDHPTATLADKVRSYLDANCAHCHRPNGVSANFDTRFTTPLTDQQLINGSLRRIYNVAGAAVIKPGSIDQSILYHRDNSLGDDAMPPLAKNLIDEDYIQVLEQWISKMDPNDSCLTATTTSLDEIAYRTNSNGGKIYLLGAHYDRFLSEISIKAPACDSGSATVNILLDGVVADSAVYFVQDTGSINVSLNVFGALEMQLQIVPPSDSNQCLLVEWENARLEDCGAGNQDLWLEAECADVGNLWTEKTDPDASNETYLVYEGNAQAYDNPPDNPESRIRFKVRMREAGSYRLFTRVHAASTNDDSFWVRANESSSWIKYNDISAQNFAWTELQNSLQGNQITKLNLVAGENTIDFAYRENGTWLDKIYISREGEIVGNDLGVTASNCIPPNLPPVALVETTPTSGIAPFSLYVDGSMSFDPEEGALNFLWDFGDGNQTGTPITSHTYTEPGNYLLKLVLQDSLGEKTYWEQLVQVNPLPNCDTLITENFSDTMGLALNDEYNYFNAQIDVDTSLCGTAVFQILTDGAVSFQSLPMSASDLPKEVFLDVNGVSHLEMKILYSHIEDSCHNAYWSNISLQKCQQPQVEDFWLEAECAEVGSSWTTVDDTSVSNGKYMVYQGGNANQLPSPSATGYIRFRFSTTIAGMYRLFARVKAPDNQHDSFWVRIDEEPWIQFNDIQALSFKWIELNDAQNSHMPVLLDLGNGDHVVDFAYRESGTLLDKIYISKTKELTGEELGLAASNCINIVPPVPVNRLPQESWQVYPNPFMNEINIRIPGHHQKVNIEIFNLKGKTIYQNVEITTTNHIRIYPKLPLGIYMIKINNGRQTATFKLLRK